MDNTIRVHGLTKAYGRHAVLEDVSFEVEHGEIFGIIGANGTGKTTTVEILQGLRTRDAGTVAVLGHDPAAHRRHLRGLVGSQLQSSALPERITVGEAVRLFAHLAGDVVDWRVLSQEWGLDGLLPKAFGSLSGGQRQRLFIALALVNRPRVVFLDELTQGLDPVARRDTWRLIERVRDHGASVVLVTHDLQEAAHLCDRVAVLHGGRIRATGTPDELIAASGGTVHTRFSIPGHATAGLDALPGVVALTHDGRRASVLGDSRSPVLVAAELARRDVLPLDLEVQRPSLDDVFLALTGESR